MLENDYNSKQSISNHNLTNKDFSS